MAAELEDRSQRIVESAVVLAEQGGFEAVRLRDVASHAGVALGTLYRRFRSKEDLLVAALDREMTALERRVLAKLPSGDSELDRLEALFTLVTRNFCRKPNLARALLKALVCGQPELAQQVAGFHARLERLIVAAVRGEEGADASAPTEAERRLAWHLDLVWYALLISWSSGVRTQAAVIDETREAARLMIEGWNGIPNGN
ncbi:MAG: TetR/AcrR family transcriptional regulator [Myxococcota bacterium]|nr:TetR/AcrR family transcriptional regulator [Myxococcales bacterium]